MKKGIWIIIVVIIILAFFIFRKTEEVKTIDTKEAPEEVKDSRYIVEPGKDKG